MGNGILSTEWGILSTDLFHFQDWFFNDFSGVKTNSPLFYVKNLTKRHASCVGAHALRSNYNIKCG